MFNKSKTKLYKLIRYSEKYTKTDMVYLTKGGFWLSLGQGVATISSFLLAIAFANLLPKEIYGQYKFIFSIIALLSIPTLQGLNTALTRAVAQGYEGSLIPVIKTKIKWGALGSLASLSVAVYYYFQGNITLTFAFLIASIFIPFFQSLAVSGNFLNGKKLFREFTSLKIILNLITTASVITTIFFTNNLLILILVYFFSYSIIRLFFILFILAKHKTNQKHNPETISYGKHLSVIQIVSIIADNIDKIILWHYLGAIELAIYSFAMAPIAQIRKALNTLVTLALPKLAQKKIQDIRKTLPFKLVKLLMLIVPIIIIYILFAPYLYKLLFPEYTKSIFYSQIFALVLLFQPVNLIRTTFTAHAHKRKIYFLSTINPIFKITAFIIFIPLFGILGAIISLLAAQFFNLILTLILFNKIKTIT